MAYHEFSLKFTSVVPNQRNNATKEVLTLVRRSHAPHQNSKPGDLAKGLGIPRGSSSVISAKKERKTIEWERLLISLRKLEIPRERR